MHNIDDCIHLIDAIEILIQRGRLKQFTRNGSPEIKTVDQIVDGNNQDVIVAMFVEQRWILKARQNNSLCVHLGTIPYHQRDYWRNNELHHGKHEKVVQRVDKHQPIGTS